MKSLAPIIRIRDTVVIAPQGTDPRVHELEQRLEQAAKLIRRGKTLVALALLENRPCV